MTKTPTNPPDETEVMKKNLKCRGCPKKILFLKYWQILFYNAHKLDFDPCLKKNTLKKSSGIILLVAALVTIYGPSIGLPYAYL